MRKKKNNEGKVYYGKTRFIDTDNKPRRRFVVTKDEDGYISVAKVGSLKFYDKDGNNLNPAFVEIKSTYKGLTKRTGVFNREYSKNRKTKERLNLRKGNGVFDGKELFELDDEDFNKVDLHIKNAKTNYRKKRRKKKKGK